MLISKIKDVASVNSAIKQTKQNHLPLRIDGAHIEAMPENKISAWQKATTIARASTNGAICVVRNSETGRAIVIHDHSTKQRFSQPELIPIWEIREGSHLDIPFSPSEPFRFFRRHSNIHPSKHHYYTKRLDYEAISNPSWRTMEKPPYMRGIDFDRPELW